ncbi:MAG: hypothetical protein R2729_14510 [Bryobacteraceae bacterium]
MNSFTASGGCDPSEPSEWTLFERACSSTHFYSEATSNSDCVRQRTPIDLDYYFTHLPDFRNASHRIPETPRLEAPWDPEARTVSVSAWFSLAGAVNLRTPTCEQIQAAEAEALAGPPSALAAVADAVSQGRLKLPGLRYGVVVFESLTGPSLHPELSRWLWRTFQAPLVRQVRGFQGELLAAECETRDGLHIPPSAYWEHECGRLLVTSFRNLRYPVARLRTRLGGELDWEKCACGHTSARIRELRTWTPAAQTAANRRLALAAAS